MTDTTAPVTDVATEELTPEQRQVEARAKIEAMIVEIKKAEDQGIQAQMAGVKIKEAIGMLDDDSYPYIISAFLRGYQKAVNRQLEEKIPEYKERMESMTFSEGKVLSLIVKVVDPELSRGLMAAMYTATDPNNLLAGCEVTRICFNDVFAQLESMKQDLFEVAQKNGMVN